MSSAGKAILALLLAGAAAYGDDAYLNSKLAKGQRRIRTALVLPAEVAIEESGQGMWEKSEAFEESFTLLVAKTLSGHGAKVLRAMAGPDAPEEARTAVRELEEKLDAMDATMLRRPEAVVGGHYSLGDGVAGYALTAEADTIVFVRGSGWAPAAGSGTGRFDGTLTFVDARSGDVMAYVRFICNSHDWSVDIDYLRPHMIDTLSELRTPLFDLMGERKKH